MAILVCIPTPIVNKQSPLPKHMPTFAAISFPDTPFQLGYSYKISK